MSEGCRRGIECLRHIDKICNGLISSDFDGEIEIIKRVISQAMSEKG